MASILLIRPPSNSASRSRGGNLRALARRRSPTRAAMPFRINELRIEGRDALVVRDTHDSDVSVELR